MKIKMELLSDAIWGNGESVPGGEDIAVQKDEQGFPYFKGTTFKGIFREEMGNYLKWTGKDSKLIDELLGFSGDESSSERLIFSDFSLSENVKNIALQEIGANRADDVLEALTNTRTFTKIDDSGVVAKGSLRVARCINAGLIFYSEIQCPDSESEKIVREVIGLIKWIGTMRNRGFGKIKLSVVEG